MPIHIRVVENGLAGCHIARDDGVRLVEENARIVNALERSEIGDERRVRTQGGVECKIDHEVGIAVETTGVVYFETVEDAVRELVITGSVIGVLEALDAHAQHQTIRFALFITAEHVQVVQVGGLVFEQERPVPVTGGEHRRARDYCERHGPPGGCEHSAPPGLAY